MDKDFLPGIFVMVVSDSCCGYQGLNVPHELFTLIWAWGLEDDADDADGGGSNETSV